MISWFTDGLNSLTFFSFLSLLFVFCISFFLAKYEYVKRRIRQEWIEIEDRDNFHVIDKLFLVVGLVIGTYLTITSQVDDLILFLQSSNIILVGLIALSVPLMLFTVFIKRLVRFFEQERSLRRIFYKSMIEFSLLIFYASFVAIMIPFIFFMGASFLSG